MAYLHGVCKETTSDISVSDSDRSSGQSSFSRFPVLVAVPFCWYLLPAEKGFNVLDIAWISEPTQLYIRALPNQSDWLQQARVSSCLLVLVSIARQEEPNYTEF